MVISIDYHIVLEFEVVVIGERRPVNVQGEYL